MLLRSREKKAKSLSLMSEATCWCSEPASRNGWYISKASFRTTNSSQLRAVQVVHAAAELVAAREHPRRGLATLVRHSPTRSVSVTATERRKDAVVL